MGRRRAATAACFGVAHWSWGRKVSVRRVALLEVRIFGLETNPGYEPSGKFALYMPPRREEEALIEETGGRESHPPTFTYPFPIGRATAVSGVSASASTTVAGAKEVVTGRPSRPRRPSPRTRTNSSPNRSSPTRGRRSPTTSNLPARMSQTQRASPQKPRTTK